MCVLAICVLGTQPCASGNGIETLHQVRSLELQVEMTVKAATQLEVVGLAHPVTACTFDGIMGWAVISRNYALAVKA